MPQPKAIACTDDDEIVAATGYDALAASGSDIVNLTEADLIPLPEGSRIFSMPGYQALALNRRAGKTEVARPPAAKGRRSAPYRAAAAFLAPGYLRLLLPAARRLQRAEDLPLWAYCAVAETEDGYAVPAVRVDPRTHWDPSGFDDRGLPEAVNERLESDPDNILLQQVAVCATEYHCFAAKNFFRVQTEAPLPIAPSCNAACLGCLSKQTDNSFRASHNRLTRVPTVDELMRVAQPHVERVENAIVSFGQGCEGDPILYHETIAGLCRALRAETERGTINLNTNGARTGAVVKLADAGLDSIRISLSSAVPENYEAYFRPQDYAFADVTTSIKAAVDTGLYTSINLFVFPGVTDRPREMDSLFELLASTGLHNVQLRNLNIDPSLYLRSLPVDGGAPVGLPLFLNELRTQFPGLSWGYFNRAKQDYQKGPQRFFDPEPVVPHQSG